MSQFMSQKFAALEPYVPGEQPKDLTDIIKLNTNESPFTMSEAAWDVAHQKMRALQLYPDPEYTELREAIAAVRGVRPSQVMVGNGSDEVLNFAFAAYCDQDVPAVFCDITYGFYPVFANYNNVPYRCVPLKEDFSVDVDALCGIGESGERATIVLANPNAPTGVALFKSDIEKIVAANSQNVVVVDEAYVDFGAQSAVCLVDKYPNLVIVQTFSKSCAFAGGRLGYAIACEDLIADLNTLRNSTNPYNVNSMTVACALGILADFDKVKSNNAYIKKTRAATGQALRNLGFDMPISYANFIFVRHPQISGQEIYEGLKAKGILVRHFNVPRIEEYNRVTIGSPRDMATFIDVIADLV